MQLFIFFYLSWAALLIISDDTYFSVMKLFWGISVQLCGLKKALLGSFLPFFFLIYSLFLHIIENYISTCHFLGARTFYFVLNCSTVEFRTCNFFVNNWCLKKENWKWPFLIIQLKPPSYLSINPFSCDKLFLFFVCIWFVLQAKWQHQCIEAAISWLVYSASSHVDLKVLFVWSCISSFMHGKTRWQFCDFCLIFIWQFWGLQDPW